MIPDNLKQEALKLQRGEITEHIIYKRLAKVIKKDANRQVLERISADELRHYEFWKGLSQQEVKPDRFKIAFYVLISRLLGLTFGIKLMERAEAGAQDAYAKLRGLHPQVDSIIEDEENHEKQLINLIDEERLKYVSSMVLGLNDALVELTGALAGFTLALQNTRLVAIVGLITGIAASMSMAAAEYLSTKQEETDKSPLKASIYTGLAYVLTVLFLIFPYLIFKNIFVCLGFVVFNALAVVLFFTFYISVAKELSFKKRFFEMATISITIAAINFFIGLLIRNVFGIEV
ncbi:MAG: VIT1/CCC1 transporter family protein [Candidatus Omnitrophota bacterium]|nr:MAG: VIT1/CCC1 transporter family protein [Candidatus Omnitrophota bacterium]